MIPLPIICNGYDALHTIIVAEVILNQWVLKITGLLYINSPSVI